MHHCRVAHAHVPDKVGEVQAPSNVLLGSLEAPTIVVVAEIGLVVHDVCGWRGWGWRVGAARHSREVDVSQLTPRDSHVAAWTTVDRMHTIGKQTGVSVAVAAGARVVETVAVELTSERV